MFLTLIPFFLVGLLSVNVDYFQSYLFSSMDGQCSGFPTRKAYYIRDECYGYNDVTNDLSLKVQLASNTAANMTIYAGTTCHAEISRHQIPFICMHTSQGNDKQWQYYSGRMVTVRTYGESNCTDVSAVTSTKTMKPEDCMPYLLDNTWFALMRNGVAWPVKETKGLMLNYTDDSVQVASYTTSNCAPHSVITNATLYFNLNMCYPMYYEESIIFTDYSQNKRYVK